MEDSLRSAQSPLVYRLLLSGHSFARFLSFRADAAVLPFHSTKNEGEKGNYINRRLSFRSCFRQSSECPLSVPDPAALEGVEILGQCQPMRRRGGGTLTQQQPTLLFRWFIACRWLRVWPSKASALCCAFTRWLIRSFYELGRPLWVTSSYF